MKTLIHLNCTFTFSIQRISQRRTIVMGVAAVMIYFAHAYSYIKLGPWEALFSLGNLGVDIFLLLSGIGICFSMRKKPPIPSFFLRRFIKVGIPYLALSIPLYFISDIVAMDGVDGLASFVLDVTTLSYWLYHHGAWYVAMLIPLYLAIPLIEDIYSRVPATLFLLCSMVPCFVLGGVLPLFSAGNDVLYNISVVVVRLPSFFIGYCLAGYYLENEPKEFSIERATLWSILAAIVWIASRRAVIFNFLPALILTFWFAAIPRMPFERFFTALGEASLESYLLNVLLLALMRDVFGWYGPMAYATVSVAAILGALIIHRPLSSLQAKMIMQ